MASKPLPPQDVLRQLLDYNPDTGVLTWKERGPQWFKDGRHSAAHTAAKWNSQNAGKEAFTGDVTGYRLGRINKRHLLAHRVIWMMVHGVDPDHIDHINGDRADNRLVNLRDVTATGNVRNSKLPCNNTSGVIGISWDRSRAKWEAHITLADRKKHIGRFPCIGQAIRARKEAERRHGFHPNHGRAA